MSEADRFPTSAAKRFAVLVGLPIAVLVLAILGAWTWAAWKDDQFANHQRGMKDAQVLCVAEAHRLYPEAISMRAYIGDEFGDDHGQVLAQLPNAAGLEIWVYTGDDGFWNSCTIRSADPIDAGWVEELVLTQPYGTVTSDP